MRSWSEPAEPAGASWRTDLAVAPWQVGIPVAVAIVALTVAVAGVGLLIEREPTAGIGHVDLRITEALVEQRTAVVDGLTGIGAELAGTITVAVLWVGAIVVATIVTRRWTLALFLLAAIGGEKLTYLLVTFIVARPRPPVEPIGTVFATGSFPSGHVGSAVTVYGGLAMAAIWYVGCRRDRPVGRVARIGAAFGVALIAGAVAFSRVWRGHHYLSDVVVGALLGLTWLAIAHRVVLQGVGTSSPGGGPARPRRLHREVGSRGDEVDLLDVHRRSGLTRPRWGDGGGSEVAGRVAPHGPSRGRGARWCVRGVDRSSWRRSISTAR